MNRYQANLVAFGVADHLVQTVPAGLVCNRKGEIWRPREGQTFSENIVRLEEEASNEDGFGPAIERLLSSVDNDVIRRYFTTSPYVELQLWVWQTDSNASLPDIHLEPSQVKRLADLGAHIDIDAYVLDPDDPNVDRNNESLNRNCG